MTNNEVGVANDGSGAAITNNTLSGNSIDGIQLFDNVTGTTISGNFIQSNGGQGVFIDTTASYSPGALRDPVEFDHRKYCRWTEKQLGDLDQRHQ